MPGFQNFGPTPRVDPQPVVTGITSAACTKKDALLVSSCLDAEKKIFKKATRGGVKNVVAVGEKQRYAVECQLFCLESLNGQGFKRFGQFHLDQ